MTGANHWFQRAIAANDPDAAYQVGHLLLLGMLSPSMMGTDEEIGGIVRSHSRDEDVQGMALELFERAAKWGSSPFAGAPFAMYNLGVAWLYGYAGIRRNPKVAVKWFEKSGLPEGLMAMSLYYKSKGRRKKAKMFQRRAEKAGFGKRPSRDQPLFALHSKWPDGPPQW